MDPFGALPNGDIDIEFIVDEATEDCANWTKFDIVPRLIIIRRHLSNSYLGKLFDKYLVINCNHLILRIRHISTGLWIEISIKIPNTLNSDHLQVIAINTPHYQYIGFLFRALLYICGNDRFSGRARIYCQIFALVFVF